MLLEHCNNQNIHEAVLQAISEDHTAIADLILKHPSYLAMTRKRIRLGDTDGFFKTEVESQFSTDMTPLNLAAQKNNFAIVQMLLQRGERIQKPHKFSCGCMECRNRMKFDQLRVANFRLNAYRGLASEAYISLSTEDPFLSAFQLAKELRNLSNDEKHFKKEYKDLANSLSRYVVKLLDRVWTQQELELVLNKKGPPETEKYENLARLKMALENKEKKFAAHPSVQQHLVGIWHQDLGKMETLGWGLRHLYIAGLALVYPFIVLVYFFVPNKQWGKLAKQPMMKFMGHTLSFMAFLTLVLVTSFWGSAQLVSKDRTLKSHYVDIYDSYVNYREFQQRKAPDFPLRAIDPTLSEIFLCVWIAGMIVQESQQLNNAGVYAHFSDLFNVVDFTLLSLYVASLMLFNWSYFKAREAIQVLGQQNCSMMLARWHETETHLYWLNTDRTMWTQKDPVIVAEGLYAMANIISFSRIANLLTANESLGPMKISLGRMLGDFLKFAFFACFAICSFMVSLRNLYWYYADNPVPNDKRNGNITDAASSFEDIMSTFRTVFWWIYGRGAMKDTLNVPSEYGENADITQEVGQWLAALYHVSVIIVFVNLLIAMMTRSFEKIVGDVDAEWKFARSVLYVEYISEGCVLPVPLNILEPARDAIIGLVQWARRRARQHHDEEEMVVKNVRERRRAACSNIALPGELGRPQENGHVRQSRVSAISRDQLTYKDAMQTIVQRYIFDIQREEEIGSGRVLRVVYLLADANN
nr:hypothetical protein BaRGS_021840 [Batillaria attramentaria]